MAKIQKRGRLVAGVSADTYLLGSRNPFTGEIEGFDIDMVKAVAKAIFGNENRYQLKVITAAQRIPALEKGDVDIVARNMTINCDRWKQIAFSTEYYRSGQKILVRKGSKANSLNDLDGQKVCAPIGTSSMDNLIKKAPKVIPVGADTHTGCLVLFQEGQVAAITGDDTVLAGLAAQDPYAVVPDQRAFTEEPYGLGFNEKDVDFVRFVNAGSRRCGPTASGPGSTTDGCAAHLVRHRSLRYRSTAGRDDREHGCRTGERTGRSGPDGLSPRILRLLRSIWMSWAAGAMVGAMSWMSWTKPRYRHHWFSRHRRHSAVDGALEGGVGSLRAADLPLGTPDGWESPS